MKKCYYFPTWEEQKNVMISLDDKEMYRYYQPCIVVGGTSMPYGDIEIRKPILLSTPSDPILAKLCELTGAKMYGSYVVFVDKACDIFSENCKGLNHYGKLLFLNKDIYVFTPADDLHPNNNRDDIIKQIFTFNTEEEYCPFTQDVIEPHARFYCNIIKEYSKFLRGEENKWEEVKKVLDL